MIEFDNQAVGLRKLSLSGEFVLRSLRDRPEYHVVDGALPGDARIVGVAHHVDTGFIDLFLVSASWRGPVDGGAVEELDPIIFNVGPENEETL